MSLWKLSSEPSGHVKENESGRGCRGAKDGCEEGVYQSTSTAAIINHQLCYFLSGDHLGEARQKAKGVYGQVWLHCTMLSTVFSSGDASRRPPVNKQNQSLGFSGGIYSRTVLTNNYEGFVLYSSISICNCILEANIVFLVHSIYLIISFTSQIKSCIKAKVTHF